MDARRGENRSIEEISDELADQWEAMIEGAERDLGEMQVRLRWHRPEIEVIKRVASRCGVPYQTYLRTAAFRQALADLQVTEAWIVVSRHHG
jgi:predicted DNA binding CopG/RHH family protein